MRLRKLWDDLQSSLWFRPALWATGFGLLALGLIAIDRRFDQALLPANRPWLFPGGADAARTMLGSIGAALLAVTTLAFSIIMVAVVQTANAYSPRILHEYLADTVHQDALGVLVGTFLFSLLVLRVIYTSDQGSFVPELSVTVAILLALLSIGGFIYFINHVAHSLKVSYIVNLTLRESEELLDDIFPGSVGEPWQADSPPLLPDDAPATVLAPDSGYIQFIEPGELLAAAMNAGIVVRLERTTGEYVLQGTPLAMVWPAEALDPESTGAIRRAFQLGKDRTLVQDLHFGVRQLYDIALRAMSPAINDPNTAITCIDALATLLAKMAARGPVSPYRCDADSNLRVIAYGPTFGSTLDLAFTQIREYGGGDVTVTLRLVEVCGELAYVARRPGEQAALWRQLGMIARSADRRLVEPEERRTVNSRIRAAAQVLGQDPHPLLLETEERGASNRVYQVEES